MNKTGPYHEGYRAYLDKIAFLDNPYYKRARSCLDRGMDWNNGWIRARADYWNAIYGTIPEQVNAIP